MSERDRIAKRLGLISRQDVERQKALLESFGLPVSYPGVDTNAVLKATELDKKVQGKSIRWVLLSHIGETVIRNDVPSDVVRDVVTNM